MRLSRWVDSIQPILTISLPRPLLRPFHTALRARIHSRSFLFDPDHPVSKRYQSLKPKKKTRAQVVFDRIDGLGIGDDSKAGKALFSLKSSGGNHHDSNAAAVKKKKRKPLTGAATYDPFSRMKASPKRSCRLTDAKLPKDFLIAFRLTPLPSTNSPPIPPLKSSSSPSASSETPSRSLYPIKLSHPRYEHRSEGEKTRWICCRRGLIDELRRDKRGYKKLSLPNKSAIPLSLESIIQTQLQSRIIQELELLGERIRHSTSRNLNLQVGTSENDHAEFLKKSVEKAENGLTLRWVDESVISGDEQVWRRELNGTVAILDVQGLKFDKSEKEPDHEVLDETRRDSIISNTTLDIPIIQYDLEPVNSSSTLLEKAELKESDYPLRNKRSIPIYPISRMMSSSFHHEAIQNINKIIRNDARYLNSFSFPPTTAEQLVQPEITPTNTQTNRYLAIQSTPELSSRATKNEYGTGKGIDTVPLCIALWRLGLWFGSGWAEKGHSVERNDGKEVVQGYTVVQGVMHTVKDGKGRY